MRAPAALLLALITLVATSCSDSTTDGTSTPRSSMSATVDERGIVMSSITHDRVDMKYFVSGTTTIDPPNENIILSFDSLTVPGIVTIIPTSNRLSVRYLRRTSATTSEEYKGISGTVKIDEISTARTSGTFSFVAQQLGATKTVSVREGSFSTRKVQ